ncbi:MAG: hypothetical protein Tsb009_06510 [Planctomycetaceae bacterium]
MTSSLTILDDESYHSARENSSREQTAANFSVRKEYICPGESNPISRSVHLARLVSFYPPCRKCPYRTETGQLPTRTVQRIQQTERRVRRPSLFTEEGIRGIYLNEFPRSQAGKIAAAFASLILEKTPLVGKTNENQTESQNDRQLPLVIVGSDQRSSSPDIAAGVISAIRRMGCDVIDLGPVSQPCLWFHVSHMSAAGGVMITGAGHDPSWTGLDFFGPDGRPVSKIPDGQATLGIVSNSELLTLNRLEERTVEGVARDSRSSGRYRTLRGHLSYEAGLHQHFHALRPLKIVLGSANPIVQRSIQRLFDPLPCHIHLIPLPQRARNVNEPDDDDVKRISEAVQNHRAHMGMVIDEDGLRCGFLDERGEHVSAADLTCLIIDSLSHTESNSVVLLDEDLYARLQNPRKSKNEIARVDRLSSSNMGAVFHQMEHQNAIFASGRDGRFWFRNPSPNCDAILCLAYVLASLSRSDNPFSQVISQAQKRWLMPEFQSSFQIEKSQPGNVTKKNGNPR